MNDELRPCPFCGAPAQQNGYAGGSFGPGALYGCSNKACEAYGAAVSLSLATWNQRPIEDALRAKWQSVPWEALQDLAQYVDNDDDPERIELWAHEALALARPWLAANAPKEPTE